MLFFDKSSIPVSEYEHVHSLKTSKSPFENSNLDQIKNTPQKNKASHASKKSKTMESQRVSNDRFDSCTRVNLEVEKLNIETQQMMEESGNYSEPTSLVKSRFEYTGKPDLQELQGERFWVFFSVFFCFFGGYCKGVGKNGYFAYFFSVVLYFFLSIDRNFINKTITSFFPYYLIYHIKPYITS